MGVCVFFLRVFVCFFCLLLGLAVERGAGKRDAGRMGEKCECVRVAGGVILLPQQPLAEHLSLINREIGRRWQMPPGEKCSGIKALSHRVFSSHSHKPTFTYANTYTPRERERRINTTK